MFVNQKTQEISYALVRVTPYIRRPDLRQRMDRLAFQLLEEAASKNFEQALNTSIALIALVNLGKSIYEIEPMNAKVITGELETLNSAIRQIIGIDADTGELPHLEEFFSKVPAVVENRQDFGNAANDQTSANYQNSNGNGINSTIRQSAILEKIRQSVNRQIQLKDILAAFPEVSERTMRYDLQKLCAQGLIERVGSGGPGSYYVIK